MDSDEEMSSSSAEVSDAEVAEQPSAPPALVQADETKRKKKGDIGERTTFQKAL